MFPILCFKVECSVDLFLESKSKDSNFSLVFAVTSFNFFLFLFNSIKSVFNFLTLDLSFSAVNNSICSILS